MDHYNTLGLARDASPDEIKQAYRKLARVHHPDKGGDTAKFQEIQQAYEILSDTAKKQEYDNPMMGGMHNTHNMHGGFNMHGFPGGFTFHTGGINIDDIFGQMFKRPQSPTYKTTIWVTLEQVLTGDNQILNFNTHEGNQTVNIDIPKGVDNGMQLRYENLIPNAVLIVEFRVHPHNKFERNNLDLYSTVDISVLDLIVGTSIKFETLSGKKLDVTVNPNSQPNSKLRIPNEGLSRDRKLGDQYLLLKPIIPDNISREVINAILQTRGN
jgi:curved DNA-binding protein